MLRCVASTLGMPPHRQMTIATKATESRRLLDTEMEQTEELLAKKRAHVERQESIQLDVKEVTKVFLCDICNKQYSKVGARREQVVLAFALSVSLSLSLSLPLSLSLYISIFIYLALSVCLRLSLSLSL